MLVQEIVTHWLQVQANQQGECRMLFIGSTQGHADPHWQARCAESRDVLPLLDHAAARCGQALVALCPPANERQYAAA